ncbi:recombinase XerC [Lampropedia cohaerens]|uniref:Tyrosine recombinase XerC n=1 Tax=Lampropedia cohaerens TaxID=1610491 RepID=A0A0U1PXA7_9BURK|nr:recombinase XerC [Lampropedia cohaerens]
MAPVALSEPARRYLDYVRVDRRLAARTLALYREDLHKLEQVAADAGAAVLALRPFHIRKAVAGMHSRGRSARGIALILSGWRSFYRWAVQEGLIVANPVQDVRAPKAPRPLPKALAIDEAVQLAAFRAPAQSDHDVAQWLERRDAALTELLYSSGLRIGEALGLDLRASAQTEQQGRGYIDWEAAEAHVIGKGSKRRSVPIGAPAMQALRQWCAVRDLSQRWPDQPALFISLRGARMSAQSAWLRMRQRSQQAGLAQPVHPHMLRHSFASHVLQSSSDLRAVQELLGHANIATTQVYTRLDFQHLARIYDEAHPRAHLKPQSGAAPATDADDEVDE